MRRAGHRARPGVRRAERADPVAPTVPRAGPGSPRPAAAPGSLAIHPVLLDMCAQLLVATVLDEPGHGAGAAGRHRPGRGDRRPVAGRVRRSPAGLVGRRRASPATSCSATTPARAVLTVSGLRCVRQRVPPRRPPGRTRGCSSRAGCRPRRSPARWSAGCCWSARAAARPCRSRPRCAPAAPPPTWSDVPLADAGARPARRRAARRGRPGLRRRRRVRRRRRAGPHPAASSPWRRRCAPRRVPPRLVRGHRAARSDESALRGVVRVLAIEHPELRATLVDVDRRRPARRGTARRRRATTRSGTARGSGRVARLAYAPGPRTPSFVDVRCGVDGFRLRAGRLGDLSSLELAACHRRRPGPGEVEIQVTAAGVNFRDVLTVLGLLPGDGHDVRYRIGFECAGVVSAVGAGVPLAGRRDGARRRPARRCVRLVPDGAGRRGGPDARRARPGGRGRAAHRLPDRLVRAAARRRGRAPASGC